MLGNVLNLLICFIPVLNCGFNNLSDDLDLCYINVSFWEITWIFTDCLAQQSRAISVFEYVLHFNTSEFTVQLLLIKSVNILVLAATVSVSGVPTYSNGYGR